MPALRDVPHDYEVRPARPGEEAEIVAAVNLATRDMIDADWLTADGLEADHRTTGFDLDRDTRVARDPHGRVVAYAAFWAVQDPPVHPYVFVRVHPDHRGRGLGSTLTGWSLRRAADEVARVPDGARVSVYCSTPSGFTPTEDLLEDLGFAVCRHSFEMRIELPEAPVDPGTVPGIRIRGYRHPDELEAVARAAQAAFRDHRGAVDEPFESYLARFTSWHVGAPEFDPDLWFLATDGERIAGILVGCPEDGPDRETAYVPILGVRPPWRRRGVALALLRTFFAEARRRRRREAALHVDAESLTGAVALYEKAGMRVAHRYDTWEKEIRPGREIARR